MLREQFQLDLKEALKSKDQLASSTLRLILAALKDKDIASRTKGNAHEIEESEIQQLLTTLVKQRRESAAMYQQGNREDLAQKELSEIKVIERYLPKQMTENETQEAVYKTAKDLDVANIKDTGRLMQELRSHYMGRMDFAKAAEFIKQYFASLNSEA